MPYSDPEKRLAQQREYRRQNRARVNEWNRRWLAKNPEFHANWRAANKAKTKAANFNWYAKSPVLGAIVWYKLTHPCVDCGEPDPIVLEFDHLPERGKKTDRIGNTYKWTPKRLPELLAEIQKCEVVCANCHKRRTETRRPHSHIMALLRK